MFKFKKIQEQAFSLHFSYLKISFPDKASPAGSLPLL